MAKKKMYTFSEHRHSRGGITSTVLGGLSLLIFLALAYVSYWFYGEGGPILGSLGFTGIVFSICGLVSGLTSFREKHIIYTFSKAGSILSSVALVLWIFVILLGVS